MTLHIGMLLYPGLTQLDLTGPYEVLHRLPDSQVHLVWKEAGPIEADSGIRLYADTSFARCPPLDVVFVPGGFGQIDLMGDAVVLDFLKKHAHNARYVTSVCTGALLLGAAGLLEGYDATTHWAFHDMLSAFGAKPKQARVVVDRNRVTGGGVTAGIDFGLRLVAELAGETLAKTIQLALEYDPKPPFDCGHPRVADPEIVAIAMRQMEERRAARQAQLPNAK
ncbi:MAG: DJ-1/PfpI family protein [Polyangiaceae bacterium]